MRFAAERFGRLVLTLLLVSIITFLLVVLLPGDPVLQALGTGDFTEADYRAVEEELGVNEPLPVRYAQWLGGAVRGDLGASFRTGQPVMQSIVERAPVTIQIAAMAVVIALGVAIPLGILSAYRAGTKTDTVITSATLGLLSVPNFIAALLLIFYLSAHMGWFPSTGWVRLTVDPVANLRTAVLPALSLAAAEIGVYTRLLRNDMLNTLQQDFITLAKAKGAHPARVLFRHALRPSTLSVATISGIQVGVLLGGSVIVETIFALPGLGRLLVDSIFQRDLLVVQGVVLFIAVAYVLVNFVVDLLYSVLDPRISRGNTRATV